MGINIPICGYKSPKIRKSSKIQYVSPYISTASTFINPLTFGSKPVIFK